MDRSLFRPEVLEARRELWLGSIHVARPPSFAWMTGVAVLISGLIVAFGIFGEFERKATLSGLLLPTSGLIQVQSPQTGLLSELLVPEGTQVAQGQPIMRVKTEHLLGAGDIAVLTAQNLGQREAALRNEQRFMEQQEAQREAAYQLRRQSLGAEMRQAQSELETYQLRESLARKSFTRYESLAKEGFMSDVQAQQKQEELLDLQLRTKSALRSLEALQRDIDALESDRKVARSAYQASLAQMVTGFTSLKQESLENEARGGLTITSPKAGVISAIAAHIGQAVQAGQTLASVVPFGRSGATELEAQLFAPSRTAGFVKAGQVVWIRYAAYPHQKFGMAKGEVTAVSQTPIATQDLPPGQSQAIVAAAQANEPLFRITVRLSAQTIATYGQPQALKAGMALEADVVQDHRAIWEWLLDPLLAGAGISSNKND